MAQSIVINALSEKRAELAGQVSDLERRITQARADLSHVDATIRLFDPSIKPAAIRAKAAPPERSAHFEKGEIAMRCRDALRDAGADGVSAAEVAGVALADKGADANLAPDFTKRMYWTLTRISREGVSRKVGQGIGARWVLAG
jgi:hypothetical protein